MPQKHDLGHQKRIAADKKFRTRQPARADMDKLYANWCRVKGHPPRCACIYGGERGTAYYGRNQGELHDQGAP